MIWALLLVPFLGGLLAFAIRPNRPRRWLLCGAAAAHAALTASAWVWPAPPAVPNWLALDPTGLLFLTITSMLFLAGAFYAAGYLRQQVPHSGEDAGEENMAESTFTGCLLLFLAMMTLVTVSRHMGLIWVAVEATTLASAPLICFHKHRRSLEATWKYLLICSVGIAIALLGNFFLAVAAGGAAGGRVGLNVEDLLAGAGRLNPVWLKAAFLLFLVGYGTKMGLAPLHTWLPDAHSEAPSVVSALLSGALLNCAFLAILRLHAVLAGAGLASYSGDILVVFGLISMAVAAVFILEQGDFKRVLAYSSVEHMGILALGVGLGGVAAFGALLHAVNHSLTKAMLFLAAGNILNHYKSKSTTDVTGVARALPWTGVLWIAGFLAIVGSPPFGPFLSELTVLQGAIQGGRLVVAGAYLFLLAVIFVGMIGIALRMTFGRRGGDDPSASLAGEHAAELLPPTEPLWSWLPPAVLGAAVLTLGLWIPPALSGVLHQAAALLGAK